MSWKVHTRSELKDGRTASGWRRFDSREEAEIFASKAIGKTSHWRMDESGGYTIPTGRYVEAVLTQDDSDEPLPSVAPKESDG